MRDETAWAEGLGLNRTADQCVALDRSSDRMDRDFIINADEKVVITGANGFIGSRVVKVLLDLGFRNLRCLARPSTHVARIEAAGNGHRDARVEVVRGNLLSRDDCAVVVENAAVIYHLAAGRGEKSFPDAFLNSAVATRNLLEACAKVQSLKRFVNVSSFAVYDNEQAKHGRLLDERCPVEKHPELRGDAYSFAKVKQDELVTEYGNRYGIPYVIVRPGWVYGPGNRAITGRVGIGTFGIFLHLGGSNSIPLTYVDNCASAIALAGLKNGIDGEVFNVVDDALPSSREFLRQYKRNVKRFSSVYVPHFASYALCYLWEKYVIWSEGQLPPVFNRKTWCAFWKKTRFSNDKLKTRVGWAPTISTADGIRRYFEACRDGGRGA